MQKRNLCLYILAFGSTAPANYSALLVLEQDGSFVFGKPNCLTIILITETLKDRLQRMLNVTKEFFDLFFGEDSQHRIMEIIVKDENNISEVSDKVLYRLEELSKNYNIKEIVINVTSSAKSIIAGSLLGVMGFLLKALKANVSESLPKLRVCYVGSNLREPQRGASRMMLRSYWKELSLQ
jgi:hypothetical protein